jgi:quercetin 2,3-dioxygenase
MLKLYPRENMGRADYGWLNTRYHFSFADYRDPARVHFGALRVINDDRIKAGSGFDPHPHQDMEIITYVRSGAVIHRDSLGNEGRTGAGEVQVMSAGTGITHAEFSDPAVDTHLFQIWIFPHTKGVAPRWDQRSFPGAVNDTSLPVLVSGYADDVAGGALMIYQNARIYGGKIAAGTNLTQPLSFQAYVVVVGGDLRVDDVDMREGDGLEVTDATAITATAGDTGAEVLVIEVPKSS